MHETKNEQQMQDQYNSDLRELVYAYRTLKNISKWLPWMLGILLAATAIILNLKKILKGE